MIAINYRIYGANSKRAILFLHGWAGDYNNFDGAARYLAKDCICVNTSMFVQEPTEPLTLDDYCSFAMNIIEVLHLQYGVEQITVVGHSFGGRMAIRLASRGAVNRIVLVDSAGMKPHKKIVHIARRAKHRLYKLLHIRSDKLGSPDYRALSPMMRRTFNNIIKCYQEQEARTIAVPTLIIWGKKDKDTPLYMARKLRRLIEDSAIVTLGGGHYSYIDDYSAFLAIVSSFTAEQHR